MGNRLTQERNNISKTSINLASWGNFPAHQTWLVDRMQALGYRANKRGVCFGFINMYLQALCTAELDKFYQRLQLIKSIEKNEIKTQTNALRTKRKTGLAAAKSSKERKAFFDKESNEDKLFIKVLKPLFTRFKCPLCQGQ